MQTPIGSGTRWRSAFSRCAKALPRRLAGSQFRLPRQRQADRRPGRHCRARAAGSCAERRRDARSKPKIIFFSQASPTMATTWISPMPPPVRCSRRGKEPSVASDAAIRERLPGATSGRESAHRCTQSPTKNGAWFEPRWTSWTWAEDQQAVAQGRTRRTRTRHQGDQEDRAARPDPAEKLDASARSGSSKRKRNEAWGRIDHRRATSNARRTRCWTTSASACNRRLNAKSSS